MAFDSERELETYARSIIQTHITAHTPSIYALDNKKAVDIVICRDGPDPKLFLIEVKFHKRAHGRLGFGSARGGGFQPEIVRRKPDYFEHHLRWLIASEVYEPEGLLFLPSATIRDYVAGGEVGARFNNIQERIFREQAFLDEPAFIDALHKWLEG